MSLGQYTAVTLHLDPVCVVQSPCANPTLDQAHGLIVPVPLIQPMGLDWLSITGLVKISLNVNTLVEFKVESDKQIAVFL